MFTKKDLPDMILNQNDEIRQVIDDPKELFKIIFVKND